jgi:hypothetical protein
VDEVWQLLHRSILFLARIDNNTVRGCETRPSDDGDAVNAADISLRDLKHLKLLAAREIDGLNG